MHAHAEAKPTDKNSLQHCLGKRIDHYASIFGKPTVQDAKAFLPEIRWIQTFSTDSIDGLTIHYIPKKNKVPTWILVTFKEQPKTWQEAFKLAKLSTEGVTAKKPESEGQIEVVLEGLKAEDGHPWAVSFDPSKQQLNAPCHLEMMPKNESDYAQTFKGNVYRTIRGRWKLVGEGQESSMNIEDNGKAQMEDKPLTWKIRSDGAVLVTDSKNSTAIISLDTETSFSGIGFSGKPIAGTREK